MREEDGDAVGFAGGFAGLCHTFGALIPPSVYYKDHPEWFALTEKGERDPSGLCVFNEELQAELIKNCKIWLRREKEPKIISVSINDGDVAYCRCEKCRAILDKGGNDTDNILYLVNKIKDGIKDEFPSVKVETLSYGRLNDFPVFVKPAGGVVVRVCGMGVGKTSIAEVVEKYGETGSDDPSIQNKLTFAKRIEQWGKYTDKIYVWDYPYNYHNICTPYPVIKSVLKTMRYYADHNVKGVFINGNADSAGFPELKFYIIAKCLDDPYMSEEEFQTYIDEFLEGYYGAGWRYIKRYLNYSYKKSNELGSAPPYKIIPVRKGKDGRYDERFFYKSRDLFEKAKSLSCSDGEYKRIHKAFLEVEYYEMWLTMDWHMEHSRNSFEKSFWVKRNRRLYEDFAKCGIQRVGERIFVPIVKNFRQSPSEYDFWDMDCVVGDRNNEIYSRELYVMIPFDLPVGTKVDFKCSYLTNNENKNGYLSVADGSGFVKNNLNPKWHRGRKYKKITLRGGVVTSKSRFAERSGLKPDGLMLKFLPFNKNGVILRVDEMDAGAYMYIKDVKIIQDK